MESCKSITFKFLHTSYKASRKSIINSPLRNESHIHERGHGNPSFCCINNTSNFGGTPLSKIKLDYIYVMFFIFFYYWRAPQQCYGSTAALKACYATLWWRWLVFSFLRVMEHRWNEIDREKPKYLEKNLSQCHFVHHKSQMDRSGIEPGPLRWQAGD
jgi:hypothetical protein